MNNPFDPPPKVLVRALDEKRVVLFVGAGVSVGAGLPSWPALLEPLANELRAEGGLQTIPDALDLAEYYELHFGRLELERRVRDLVDDVKLDPSPLQRELVKLPVRAIFTTNYDRLLERALTAERIPYDVKILDNATGFGGTERVSLIKMHGDIFTPESIVLTRGDYENYETRYPTLVRYLTGLITNCVFLFVGYSLQDQDFRQIWSTVHRDLGRYGLLSYALLKQPEPLFVKQWRQRNLVILGYRDHADVPAFFSALQGARHARSSAEGPDETGDDDGADGQSEEAKESVLEMRWRQSVLGHWQWIDTRGIFQFDKTVERGDVELLATFVAPRLAAWTAREPQQDKEDKEDKEDKAKEAKKAPTGVVPYRAVLDAVRCTVIIGDPGVGKSTLLHAIAVLSAQQMLADEDAGSPVKDLLPWVVELRDYSATRARRECDGLQSYLVKRCLDGVGGLDAPRLLDWLDQGRLLLLFDGLDEVDPARRRSVADEVAALCNRHARCRFVVSSRPAGYQDVRMVGAFFHYTLEPFDDNELFLFFQGWFEVFASWNVARDPHASAKALHQEVLAAPRVRAVAENPLMATILLRVHRVGRELPQRRADFYDAAVRTIGRSWELHKYGEHAAELPDLDEIVVALGEAAFAIHRNEEDNVVPVATLRRWLLRTFTRLLGRSPETAETQVERFLKLVLARTGLMVHKGFDKDGQVLLGFVHLTFQEYFAARFVAENAPRSEREATMLRYLHDPRWDEVLRLLVGQLKRDDATAALRQILDAGSADEDLLYRDLFFAASCIADDPPFQPEIGNAVVEHLQTLYLKYAPDDRALEALRLLFDLTRLVRWREALQRWLETNGFCSEHWVCRQHALRCAARRAARYESAIGAGLKDHDEEVRIAAVEAYAQLPPTAQNKYESAFAALFDDDEGRVRIAAVEAYGKLPLAATKNADAFLALLDDDEFLVRRAAFETLKELPKALQAQCASEFVKRLVDGSILERSFAIKQFARDLPSSLQQEHAITYLRQLDDDDHNIRRVAVEGFEVLSPAVKEACSECIIGRLEDSDADVRAAAARAFVNLPEATQKAHANAFIECLKDEYQPVREAAARAYAELPSSLRTQHAGELVARLQDDDEDEDVLQAAIPTFGTLPATLQQHHAEAIIRQLDRRMLSLELAVLRVFGKYAESLKARLASIFASWLDTDDDERRAVAFSAFNQLPVTTQKDHARSFVRGFSDESDDVRRAAFAALDWLSAEVLEQLPPLADILEKGLADDDDDVWFFSIQNIEALPLAVEPSLAKALVARFGDRSSVVRTSAMGAFSKLSSDLQRKHLDALVERLSDYHPEVRGVAAGVFSQLPQAIRLRARPRLREMLAESDARLRDGPYIALRSLAAARSTTLAATPPPGWPGSFGAEAPEVMRALVARVDRLATLADRHLPSRSARKKRIVLSYPLMAFGEALLAARCGESSLLQLANEAGDQSPFDVAATPAPLRRQRLLASWRLAALCASFFEPIDALLRDAELPLEVRRELGQIYALPWDAHRLQAYLPRLAKAIADDFGFRPGPTYRGYGAYLLKEYLGETDAMQGVYLRPIGDALLLSALPPDMGSFAEPQRQALCERMGRLSPRALLAWLLRFIDTLLEPWRWIADEAPNAAEVIAVEGVQRELGDGEERWVLGETLRVNIDLRWREAALERSGESLADWWGRAKAVFSGLTVGIAAFPTVEVVLRAPDGGEQALALRRAASPTTSASAATGRAYELRAESTVRAVSSESVTSTSGARALDAAILRLKNASEAADALAELLPFHRHASFWSGPEATRAIESLRSARLLMRKATRERAGELLAELAPFVTADAAKSYVALLGSGIRNKALALHRRQALVQAANRLALEEPLFPWRPQLLSLLLKSASDTTLPQELRDEALSQAAGLESVFDAQGARRLGELCKERLSAQVAQPLAPTQKRRIERAIEVQALRHTRYGRR